MYHQRKLYCSGTLEMERCHVRKWQDLQNYSSDLSDSIVNMKWEIRRKQMASCQNFVYCSHNPSWIFQCCSSAWNNSETIIFRLKAPGYVWCFLTAEDHMCYRIYSKASSYERKKEENFKVMETSHAANKHKISIHTHTHKISNEMSCISRPETFLFRNKDF